MTGTATHHEYSISSNRLWKSVSLFLYETVSTLQRFYGGWWWNVLGKGIRKLLTKFHLICYFRIFPIHVRHDVFGVYCGSGTVAQLPTFCNLLKPKLFVKTLEWSSSLLESSMFVWKLCPFVSTVCRWINGVWYFHDDSLSLFDTFYTTVYPVAIIECSSLHSLCIAMRRSKLPKNQLQWHIMHILSWANVVQRCPVRFEKNMEAYLIERWTLNIIVILGAAQVMA